MKVGLPVVLLTMCFVINAGTSPSHAAVIPSSFNKASAKHAVLLKSSIKSKHFIVKPSRLYFLTSLFKAE